MNNRSSSSHSTRSYPDNVRKTPPTKKSPSPSSRKSVSSAVSPKISTPKRKQAEEEKIVEAFLHIDDASLPLVVDDSIEKEEPNITHNIQDSEESKTSKEKKHLVEDTSADSPTPEVVISESKDVDSPGMFSASASPFQPLDHVPSIEKSEISNTEILPPQALPIQSPAEYVTQLADTLQQCLSKLSLLNDSMGSGTEVVGTGSEVTGRGAENGVGTPLDKHLDEFHLSACKVAGYHPGAPVIGGGSPPMSLHVWRVVHALERGQQQALRDADQARLHLAANQGKMQEMEQRYRSLEVAHEVLQAEHHLLQDYNREIVARKEDVEGELKSSVQILEAMKNQV